MGPASSMTFTVASRVSRTSKFCKYSPTLTPLALAIAPRIAKPRPPTTVTKVTPAAAMRPRGNSAASSTSGAWESAFCRSSCAFTALISLLIGSASSLVDVASCLKRARAPRAELRGAKAGWTRRPDAEGTYAATETRAVQSVSTATGPRNLMALSYAERKPRGGLSAEGEHFCLCHCGTSAPEWDVT
eukprot:scaffold149_cov315-Pinguiococcus_pyrenoidosus.AAC.79